MNELTNFHVPLLATPFLIVAWISRQSLSDGPHRFLIVLRSLNDDTLFTFNWTIIQIPLNRKKKYSADSLIAIFLAKKKKTLLKRKLHPPAITQFFFCLFFLVNYYVSIVLSWWSWYPFNDISTTATTISKSECISSRFCRHRGSTTGNFPFLCFFPHSFRSQNALDVLMKWINPCRYRSRNGIEIGNFFVAHLESESNRAHIRCLRVPRSHQCRALGSLRWDVTDVCKFVRLAIALRTDTAVRQTDMETARVLVNERRRNRTACTPFVCTLYALIFFNAIFGCAKWKYVSIKVFVEIADVSQQTIKLNSLRHRNDMSTWEWKCLWWWHAGVW